MKILSKVAECFTTTEGPYYICEKCHARVAAPGCVTPVEHYEREAAQWAKWMPKTSAPRVACAQPVSRIGDLSTFHSNYRWWN